MKNLITTTLTLGALSSHANNNCQVKAVAAAKSLSKISYLGKKLIVLMTLIMSTSSFATPCKIHILMHGIGYGIGWEVGSEDEAKKRYANAIRKMGHIPADTPEEADYFLNTYYLKLNEIEGWPSFRRKGTRLNISTALTTAENFDIAKVIAQKRWFSCFAPEGSSCGPMTVIKHVRRSIKRMEKIIPDNLSCNP